MILGVLWTGGSLNPARSLAPAIVTRSFPSYHWIYWVGPISGSIIASLLYKLIKALEYETAQNDDNDDTAVLLQSRKQPDPSTVRLNSVHVTSQQPANTPPPNSAMPATGNKEDDKSGLPICTAD
jgi:aquaporin related protein